MTLRDDAHSEALDKLADVHRHWCNYCRGDALACLNAPSGGCSLRDYMIALTPTPPTTKPRRCIRPDCLDEGGLCNVECPGGEPRPSNGRAAGLENLRQRVSDFIRTNSRDLADWREEMAEVHHCIEAFAQSPQNDSAAMVPAETWAESNRCYLEQFDRAEKLTKELGALQAQLDRVMLEHCPDEMTPEQMENWGKHQRAVR